MRPTIISGVHREFRGQRRRGPCWSHRQLIAALVCSQQDRSLVQPSPEKNTHRMCTHDVSSHRATSHHNHNMRRIPSISVISVESDRNDAALSSFEFLMWPQFDVPGSISSFQRFQNRMGLMNSEKFGVCISEASVKLVQWRHLPLTRAPRYAQRILKLKRPRNAICSSTYSTV
jgi:hypothetical protein